MGILTQRVEIFSESDPLNSTFIDIPVHKGEKIMCHEPYVLEALKMYAGSCTDEVMDAIAQYEKLGKFIGAVDHQLGRRRFVEAGEVSAKHQEVRAHG